mmetsp:Transcript_12368/g.35369  ORF Transcript_12368/g.35369 Transcript_12368/m.35369 type:complete len:157 (-) Transcript_12368:173-643(-)|eukprot:CAMPEP_0181046352 /NCGR_PEP_ID=MMETSP1070-20121207/14298_1 /TAXON_ID=265543 /ORGANISM="Minutocellus polymorphus, Strain NH13" /LENGTH=156 /DNA_ID=CAMNT_0023124947 /DNA_START=141 /DNA_END=611 /DNA_ORIENTATION=+
MSKLPNFRDSYLPLLPTGRIPERPSPNAEDNIETEEEARPFQRRRILIDILGEALDITDPFRATATSTNTSSNSSSSSSTGRRSSIRQEQPSAESQRFLTDAVHRSLLASDERRAECAVQRLFLEQLQRDARSDVDDDENDDDDDGDGGPEAREGE